MDYIGSICFLIKIKKSVMRLLVYLLSFLLCTNVNAATSSVSFFRGQLHDNPVVAENMLKVDIFYYRDFPYRQRYTHQEIKDCIKIPARGIVRCKESVSLIRPESLVNGWLHSQYEKGYLPLTMKLFGVTNRAGHINKVTPAGFLSVNKKMDDLKSQYVPATGLFIRHVLDVREYTFKNIKTNVIFSVKATPEHPVYVANRRDFIPVSQLSPEDHLLSDNGDKIQLLCRYSINQGINQGINKGIKKGCGVPFNQGRITRVYNIETSWRHTYFVQGERLLVHNCNAKIKKSNEADEGFYEGFNKSDGAVAGDNNKVHLFLRQYEVDGEKSWSNHKSKNTYTLDEVKALRMKVKKLRGEPYQSMRIEGVMGAILGVIDREGYIGAHSSLNKLSLQDGRLVNGSKLVMDKPDSFIYRAEMKRQNLLNLKYHLMKDLLPVGAIAGIMTLAVGSIGGVIAGFIEGFNSLGNDVLPL